jgi:hypothetical protein
LESIENAFRFLPPGLLSSGFYSLDSAVVLFAFPEIEVVNCGVENFSQIIK